MKDRRIITAIPKNGDRLNDTSSKAAMQSSELLRLFIDDLMDIYWLEKASANLTPKMIKDATSPGLIGALTSHHAKVIAHVARVEQVFELISQKAADKKSDAALGLIRDAVEAIDSCKAGAMCDAVIISAAQKIEHYQIALYKTLCQFAETLGLSEVVKLLAATLDEEKDANEKLSQLASGIVRVKAPMEIGQLGVN